MRSVKIQPGSAQERILEAAADCFSSSAYEGAGLREIGRRAGVDVAYVHRCFGSKEQLFAEVVARTAEASRSSTSCEKMKGLVAQALEEEAEGRPGLLRLLAPSLSSPEAAAVARRTVEEEILKPLGAQPLEKGHEPAFLVASLLFGANRLQALLYPEGLSSEQSTRIRRALCNAVEKLMPRRAQVCGAMNEGEA